MKIRKNGEKFSSRNVCLEPQSLSYLREVCVHQNASLCDFMCAIFFCQSIYHSRRLNDDSNCLDVCRHTQPTDRALRVTMWLYKAFNDGESAAATFFSYWNAHTISQCVSSFQERRQKSKKKKVEATLITQSTLDPKKERAFLFNIFFHFLSQWHSNKFTIIERNMCFPMKALLKCDETKMITIIQHMWWYLCACNIF